MKKLLAALSILLVLILAACGSSDSEEKEEATADEPEEKQEEVELVVGASSVPHAEILEEAEDLLKEEGITLKIEAYQDYILPNEDLAGGTLDANYFQHIPYFEDQIEVGGYDFENLGGIHIEPMGIYSKNITNLDDVEDGTELILSRSVADHGRVLALAEEAGLIKLDESVDKVSATVDDVVENPKNLVFSADVDAALLPEMYEREKDSLVAINTNYAIEADLSPLEDALVIEGNESPYVNIIAVRSEDKDNESLLKLVEVLHSDEIQDFILETYNGEVVPVK